MVILTLLAAYPELYAGYEAERLTETGNTEEAYKYHLVSAAIRVARGVRLIEILLVRVVLYFPATEYCGQQTVPTHITNVRRD